MKLYATTESERGGRPAKKGGNEQLDITLYQGNKEIGLITFSPKAVGVEIYDVMSVGSKKSIKRDGNRFEFNL